MKKLVVTLFIMHLSVVLCAQHDFRPGYLITNENDTIRGFIDNNPEQENAVYCNFKKELLSEITTYKTSDIKEFELTGSKRYVLRNVTLSNISTNYFLELVSRGVINLYYIKNLGFPYYFIEKSNQMYALRNDKISFTENGTTYTTNTNRYKNVLSLVMNDAPSISKEIEKTDFTRTDLIKLLERYHAQLNKTNEFAVQSTDNGKDRAKWGVKYGVSVGLNYTYMNANDDLTTYSAPSTNAPRVIGSNMPDVYGNKASFYSLHISPGLFVSVSHNSKHSFQVEVNYARRKFETNDLSISSTYIITPIIYKREFRNYKKLKPFFDIGLCLYHIDNRRTNMNVIIKEPDGSNTQYDINDETSTLGNVKNHIGFLNGFGCSYPLTKRNSLEFEVRIDYTQYGYDSRFGPITINSNYKFVNFGFITRFCF